MYYEFVCYLHQIEMDVKTGKNIQTYINLLGKRVLFFSTIYDLTLLILLKIENGMHTYHLETIIILK